MKEVSIITINYNNRDALGLTINSVKKQIDRSYEFIIIDGGSNDGSVDIIKQNEDCVDYWVSEPDKGIYNAMNKGLKHCTARWVFFLNSGDVFSDKYVLASVKFPDYDLNIGAVYGRYKYYSRYNELLVNNVQHPFTESKKMYRGMGFSHQSVFVRTDLALKFGFDESFKLCADYNMMMQIFKAGYKFERDNTIIAICDGRGGASYNNRHLQNLEQARVCGCDKDLMVLCYLKLIDIVRPIYRIIRKIRS